MLDVGSGSVEFVLDVPVHDKDPSQGAPGSPRTTVATRALSVYPGSRRCGGNTRCELSIPAFNLERATKLLRIIPALVQSSDCCCIGRDRYKDYDRGKVGNLTEWLHMLAGLGSSWRTTHLRLEGGDFTPECGEVTRAFTSLISPAPSPRHTVTMGLIYDRHLRRCRTRLRLARQRLSA